MTAMQMQAIIEGGPPAHNWRRDMALQLAMELDMDRFGIQGIYLFGSAEYGNTGPASDIDLIVYTQGGAAQQAALQCLLRHYNRQLCEVYYRLAGCRCETLLDIHYVTDEDIARRTQYATRITSLYEPAEPLRTLPPARRAA